MQIKYGEMLDILKIELNTHHFIPNSKGSNKLGWMDTGLISTLSLYKIIVICPSVHSECACASLLQCNIMRVLFT